jgi:hypothetical protein
MSLSHSLGKDTGVLRVEKEVNPRQLHVLPSVVPLSTVHFLFLIPLVNQNCLPLTGSVFIPKQTLSRNGREITLIIESQLDPLVGESAIILLVIKRLQW